MAFPNEAQQRVIDHRGGPLVVLAGPGSGKTATLVERIMTILAAQPDAPVVFLTFTRMSRRDTANKLDARFGPARIQDDETALPRVATLHTFAKSLVHRGANHVGLHATFSVLIPPHEDEIVFREASEDLGMNADIPAIRRHVEARRYMDADIMTPGLTAEEAGRLLPRIEELLHFYNATDLPSLVNRARLVLERAPDILGHVLLHVDEFQDLNPADQNLVHTLLSLGRCEVVVVGDDDQSIYGGRLANPDGIRQLMADDGWTRIVLREYHRLPGHILRASQALLHLQKRPGLDKHVVMPPDDGQKVVVYQCTKVDIENRRVVRDIKRRSDEGKSADRPYRFSDFMVLSPYRKGLTAIADSLAREGIPFRIKTRYTIPADLWRLLLLLRMIRGDDHIALRQWLPALGLTDDEIRRSRHEAEAAGSSLFEHARQVNNPTLRDFLSEVDALRERSDDLVSLLRLMTESRVAPLPDGALAALRSAVERSLRDGRRSVSSPVRSLYEEYGLLDPEDDTPDEDKVLLCTLHSAKGLESRVVYIVHLDDRFIPAAGRDPDEEVRVLYVGMTRAKEILELSFTERFDRNKRRYLQREAASSFLLGIQAYLQFNRITAKDL